VYLYKPIGAGAEDRVIVVCSSESDDPGQTTIGSGLLVHEIARIELVGHGLIPQATIQ
jgi:hypothetical protein